MARFQHPYAKRIAIPEIPAQPGDGFRRVAGYLVQVEGGYITRVCTNEDNGTWGVPYIPCKTGGWDNAYRELTVEAFRARVRRGTVKIA